MLTDEERNSIALEVKSALYEVYDPEIGVNIIDLGLVYSINVDTNGFLTIQMTLTTPGCPMHESLSDGVGRAVASIPNLTGGTIDLVWDPPWSPDNMTDEGRRQLSSLY